MIQGKVNELLEAVIDVDIEETSGRKHRVKAIIDTGFSGSMTLPPDLIESLRLPWRTRGSAVLANGKIDQFDIYAATVLWEGVRRKILVEAANTEPLVGMSLLRDHALEIHIKKDGLIALSSLEA